MTPIEADFDGISFFLVKGWWDGSDLGDFFLASEWLWGDIFLHSDWLFGDFFLASDWLLGGFFLSSDWLLGDLCGNGSI